MGDARDPDRPRGAPNLRGQFDSNATFQSPTNGFSPSSTHTLTLLVPAAIPTAADFVTVTLSSRAGNAAGSVVGRYSESILFTVPA